MVKISSLTDIVRTSSVVLYREMYTATAVLSHNATLHEPKRVEFTIERRALGPHHIHAAFLDDIDCPLAPAIAALSSHIGKLHQDGELP